VAHWNVVAQLVHRAGAAAATVGAVLGVVSLADGLAAAVLGPGLVEPDGLGWSSEQPATSEAMTIAVTSARRPERGRWPPCIPDMASAG
jgi:hypothetical protein